jgi:hypothetical protein
VRPEAVCSRTSMTTICHYCFLASGGGFSRRVGGVVDGTWCLYRRGGCYAFTPAPWILAPPHVEGASSTRCITCCHLGNRRCLKLC